jgi:hypothetical protein
LDPHPDAAAIGEVMQVLIRGVEADGTALRGGLPFWSAIVEFADRSNCLVSLLLVASRLVTQSDNARRLNDIATALVRWQLLLLGAGRASRTSPSIAVQESTIPDNDQAFSAED